MLSRRFILPLFALALLATGCVHEDTRYMILRPYETGDSIKGTVNFTTREASLTLASGEILKGELSATVNGQASAELTSPTSKLVLELTIGLNSHGEIFGEARSSDGRQHFRIQL